jgi:hypothetical protein
MARKDLSLFTQQTVSCRSVLVGWGGRPVWSDAPRRGLAEDGTRADVRVARARVVVRVEQTGVSSVVIVATTVRPRVGRVNEVRVIAIPRLIVTADRQNRNGWCRANSILCLGSATHRQPTLTQTLFKISISGILGSRVLWILVKNVNLGG